MSQPLVSVIIPTHERVKYAVPTIKTILALKGDIEVVVCDTSAENHISQELQGTPGLSRLRLVRPGRPLSVVDNFNTALAAATGKYLTFIGDDDFVTEQIVAVANWAESKHIDAIKFSFPSLYFWPDFSHKTQNDAFAGTLRTSTFSGKVTTHDAKAAARQAMANFGGGVMEMPRAYAGLVSMELVKRIQAKYGPLFGGVSPDIYSAFLLSQEAHACVHIDYPVIVPGASGASTAGQSAKGTHVGALRDNAHIRPFLNLVWDERVPEFYSVPTVWSFSLLKAVEKHGTPTAGINFARLYLKCFIFHRQYLRSTMQAFLTFRRETSLVKLFLSSTSAVFSEAVWIAQKIGTRLASKIKKIPDQLVNQNLCDTVTASVALQVAIDKHPIQLVLP